MNRSIFVILVMTLLSARDAAALEWRGGAIDWKWLSGLQYQFTVQVVGKASEHSDPPVGSVVNLGNVDVDGTALVALNATVVGIDDTRDLVSFRQVFTYTFAAEGSRTVSVTLCCRPSTLVDSNASDNFRIATIIPSSNAFTESPRLQMLELVRIYPGDDLSLDIFARTTDAYTFRLATAAESGMTTAAPAGLTVSSNGRVTWDTSGKSGGTRSVQLIATSAYGGSSALDFLVQLGGVPDQLPVVTSSARVLEAFPGTQATVTLSAQDPENANTTLFPLYIDVPNAVLGADTNAGVGATRTLSVTLPADAAPLYAVYFMAVDANGRPSVFTQWIRRADNCGNGAVDPGEECDPGSVCNDGTTSCTASPATCIDGPIGNYDCRSQLSADCLPNCEARPVIACLAGAVDEPCDDEDPCTTNDRCNDAVCAGSAVDEGTSCDDDDPCTPSSSCTAGTCSGAAIDVDGDGVCAALDCDDGDFARAAGEPEVVGDGIDQNCDSLDSCYVDSDLDGIGGGTIAAATSCDLPGFAATGGDCDDDDATRSPSALEIVADGLDHDCDGNDLCYADADDDGFGDAATVLGAGLSCDDTTGATSVGGDCDDADDTVYPAGDEVVGDGIDQDCDGRDACYADTDLDGVGTSDVIAGDDLDCGNTIGESETSDDCDDSHRFRAPGLAENPSDGVDQDCDGVDQCHADNDGDGFGDPWLLLAAGTAGCVDNGDDCDDGADTVKPGAAEITADGVDQDCDGVDVCYEDLDADGVGSPVTILGEGLDCALANGASAVALDCDDTDADDDRDDDGLCNVVDACPYADDADADGVCDDRDQCLGYDDAADSDSDGVPDGCDSQAPGEDPNTKAPAEGCSCNGAGSGWEVIAALVVAAMLRRRRRRSAPAH